MFKFEATVDTTDPVVMAARDDARNRREVVDVRPYAFTVLKHKDNVDRMA